MNYHVLPSSILDLKITYHRPDKVSGKQVSLDDPALDVMTDFKKVIAVTISPRESIETANQRMIQKAIRSLFVVDLNDNVLGLITASDILGEKPIQFIQSYGGQRKDITVENIMVHRENLEVLSLSDVSHARVGDIVDTLKHDGRQHAVVVDTQGPNNEKTIRGIISLTQIARQLGINIQIYELAHTFAEIAEKTQR